MERVEIFEDIALIVNNDYAGTEEIPYVGLHAPFLTYSAQLSEYFTFEDEQLYNFVQIYMAVIGDRTLKYNAQDHAGFQRYTRGFCVRSDGSDLYVTKTNQESMVRPGDKILEINHHSPSHFRNLMSQSGQELLLTERDCWEPFLNHANVIGVLHEDGKLETIILNKYPPVPFTPENSCQALEGGSVLLRLQSFEDPKTMARLLDENHRLLSSCDRLVIDLRRNVGGVRESLLPLLPYVVPRDTTTKAFFPEGPIYTRYTERNCDLSIAEVAPFLNSEDEEVRALAAKITAEVEAHRGQGLQLDMDDEEDIVIRSRRSARKVVLITDVDCEDEAEWFALGCRSNMGVILVGRPTAGSLDYSNPVTVDYGFGRTFTYPISKTKRSHDGKGYNRSGVPVDVYVPWTPAEISDDLLLQRAMAL